MTWWNGDCYWAASGELADVGFGIYMDGLDP